MTTQTIEPVRKQITVQAPPEQAFEVFTGRMTRWWNRDYKIGAEALAAVVVEPHEGGRWYERGEQGGECDWGRVLVWDPPHRVVLTWQISPEWKFDPDLRTEVEVRFDATGTGTTAVALEHRGLESFGAAGEAMRGVFDSAGGWAGLLQRFSAARDG